MVKRLKVKKGSFIDAIAEMVPYSRKEQFGIGYKLLTISFSEFQMDSKDKEVPEKKTKEDALREAAEILATNPFAYSIASKSFGCALSLSFHIRLNDLDASV